MRVFTFVVACIVACLAHLPSAAAQATRCEIPREARDIWRCERGFVIGPENVIIRLPIPETDPEALYNAGIEAAGREDWRVAIAYFTAAHQRAHLVPRYMYNLGLAHGRAGNEVAAIAWLAAYLIAEPNAPNRAAIWEQIRQLETATSARTELLWQRAEDSVQVGTRAISDPTFRAAAYEILSTAHARAGQLQRARELGRLALIASFGATSPTPEAIAQLNSNLANTAAWFAGREDYDMESAAQFALEAPADQQSSLAEVIRGTWARNDIDVRWPLMPYSRVLEYIAMAPRASAESLRDGLGIHSIAAGNDGGTPMPTRWHAYPFLDRAPEAIAAMQRLAADDWSGEPYDAELRGDDVIMQMMGGARIAQATDDVLRSYMAESSAGLLGEACLRRGDTACATTVGRLARTIANRSARSAPGINVIGASADSGEPVFSEYHRWRAENFVGYSAARLEALLMAENGNIDGAVEHLTIFLSQKSRVFARYEVQPRLAVEGNRISDIPGLTWSEARFLGIYTISYHLGMRERFEEALQLAEQLDSMRRQVLYQALRRSHYANVPEAPPGITPMGERRTPLEESILVARTLGGAAVNLPAWLSGIGATSEPTRQIRLLTWAAEDLARGVRRTRAAYERAGGRWGQ